MPAEPKSVAAGLQEQADKAARAQEVIDRDPEAAKDLLEPAVKVTPGAGEVTMQDMFGLFMQLATQQQTMQAQIVDLLSREKQAQKQTHQAHTAEDLAVAQEQQRRTLDAWRTEPRIPVFLEPDEDEKKICSVVGEYPPRMHRVNGLEFPIKVGEVVSVPESIAAQISWAQTYVGQRRKPAQPLPSIADPDRGQFLAGSQSISPGRQGKVGEGPLVAAAAALSPDAAQPLDARYDAYGR